MTAGSCRDPVHTEPKVRAIHAGLGAVLLEVSRAGHGILRSHPARRALARRATRNRHRSQVLGSVGRGAEAAVNGFPGKEQSSAGCLLSFYRIGTTGERRRLCRDDSSAVMLSEGLEPRSRTSRLGGTCAPYNTSLQFRTRRKTPALSGMTPLQLDRLCGQPQASATSYGDPLPSTMLRPSAGSSFSRQAQRHLVGQLEGMGAVAFVGARVEVWGTAPGMLATAWCRIPSRISIPKMLRGWWGARSSKETSALVN